MDVRVKFGDSMLSDILVIRLVASLARFTYFYSIQLHLHFCSRLEAAIDIIAGSFVGRWSMVSVLLKN